LTSEAIPAAGMVWPIIDLTDPITAGARPPAGRGPKTWAIVASSAASPVGVAVPCASSMPSASAAIGSSPASAQARRTAITWPVLSGLNRLAARPSLEVPVPRMTA